MGDVPVGSRWRWMNKRQASFTRTGGGKIHYDDDPPHARYGASDASILGGATRLPDAPEAPKACKHGLDDMGLVCIECNPPKAAAVCDTCEEYNTCPNGRPWCKVEKRCGVCRDGQCSTKGRPGPLLWHEQQTGIAPDPPPRTYARPVTAMEWLAGCGVWRVR